MEELIKNIESLLRYSDSQLYVIIGIELSKNVPFDITQIMQSQEMLDYEEREKDNLYHTKDFLQIMNGKIQRIDRWYHMGKSWFVGNKNKFQISVCSNKLLKSMRKDNMVEIVIDVMNLILSDGEKASLTLISSSILIARKGLNEFCKDFDNKNM